eukprot:1238170-Alexandrium_andersonii.AAC.1
MPLCTSGFPSSFFMPGSPREVAEAGCSCRKCAPRDICALRSWITKSRWMRASTRRRSTSAGFIRG